MYLLMGGAVHIDGHFCLSIDSRGKSVIFAQLRMQEHWLIEILSNHLSKKKERIREEDKRERKERETKKRERT